MLILSWSWMGRFLQRSAQGRVVSPKTGKDWIFRLAVLPGSSQRRVSVPVYSLKGCLSIKETQTPGKHRTDTHQTVDAVGERNHALTWLRTTLRMRMAKRAGPLLKEHVILFGSNKIHKQFHIDVFIYHFTFILSLLLLLISH